MQIGAIETSPQLLNKDQVNSIIEILEKDYITPLIETKFSEIRKTDEYKTKLDTIEKAKTEYNKIYSQVFSKKTGNYFSLNSSNNDIFTELGYNSSVWSIQRFIRSDIKARLQLIQVDNFDTIIENIKKYIDIDKYIKIDNFKDNNCECLPSDCCEN